MFKHFIGKVHLLEKPPIEKETQLNITFPDSIVGDIDEEEYKDDLLEEHIDKIKSFKKEMYSLLGKDTYISLLKQNIFQTSDSDFIKRIAIEMLNNPHEWRGLVYLNSDDVNEWPENLLFKILRLKSGWDTPYRNFIYFLKVLTNNWHKTIPQLLKQLESHDIFIDDFFKLERHVSFKFSAIVKDINILHKEIVNNNNDISPFVSRVSHVFLPSVVYQLEEYGLPRMLSRKMHKNRLFNFLREDLTIHDVIFHFNSVKKEEFLYLPYFDDFDRYILEYFLEGISYPKFNSRK